MGWLFNLLYLLAWTAMSPWCLWRVLIKGKPIVGFREKLSGHVSLQPTQARRVWLHAVSVGEVNLLVHLLPRLQQRWPNREFVVSSTTQTGHELASRTFGASNTCFLPFDFTWSVDKTLDRIQPNLIVLAELEIWPNLLRIAHRRNIPIAVVNGRLSQESFCNYRRLRWLLRSSFAKLSWVGAQNREYAQRFATLGVDASRVEVTGNMKFDGAQSCRGNPRTTLFRKLLDGASQQIVWLAGSTQDPEERLAIQCYQTLRKDFPQLRLIVAPRHPQRCESVIQEIRAQGLVAIRRTTMQRPHRLDGNEVLIIDTVGELSAWWGLSQIAFVGGSMGDRGGQNMIEPAAYGCAVSFGPNTKNFRDVVALLLENDAAIVVNDARDLDRFVRRCLQDQAWREQLGLHAQRLVLVQAGATERTVERLSALLASPIQTGEKAA